MFDLWLDEGTKIVKEIIEESNLKEITAKVLKDYMETESFANMIERKVTNEVSMYIEEYVEDYMIGDDGWDEVADKIKEIIVQNAKEKVDRI